MTSQDLPDTFSVGHGRRSIAVNAERQDATIPDQPDNLGIDFRRVFQNRAGLFSRYEQAIIAVAAVGKAFGYEAKPTRGREPLQERARLAQQGKREPLGRRDHTFGHGFLALRLIVERAVGLEEPDAGTQRIGLLPEALNLLEDEALGLLGRDVALAAAKMGPVGITGMGAHDDSAKGGKPQGLANRCHVASVGAAADAGRGDSLQQGLIVGAALA